MEGEVVATKTVPASAVRQGDELLVAGLRAHATRHAFRTRGEEYVLYWRVGDFGPTGSISLRGYMDVIVGWGNDNEAGSADA